MCTAHGAQTNFVAPYLTYASYRHMSNDDINVPRFPHFSMPAIPRLANGLAAHSASKKRPREVLIYVSSPDINYDISQRMAGSEHFYLPETNIISLRNCC